MAWLPILSKRQLEERRREAARLLRQGRLSQAEIARELGVSRAAVCQWAKQLEQQGLRGLAARAVSGRPAQMSRADWRRLLTMLKRGAKRAGFPTERWTLIRIQLVIWREFGCAYSLPHIWRQLHRLGWSPQCPIARASERDDELVEAWLKHDWPRIKKARRRRAAIVFIDEVGFSFLAALGRTWAPCGHPPLLRRVTQERRGFSTIVGLTLSGCIFKRHFKGSIHSQEVVLFLEHLIRHQSGPLILLWDRGSTHRSKKVKAFLADHPELDIEWLPKYAPEVNPEEVCHGTVKQRLRNLTPSDEAEYRYHVDREFARLRRRPDLVIGFFHHAGLSVKRLW